MTPLLINEGPVWVLGIAWNADMLAAFLAWWMPLNLLSFLLFLATGGPLFGIHRWNPGLFSLGYILAMTLFFWAQVVAIVVVALGLAVRDAWRGRKRMSNLEAYTVNKELF